MIKHLRTILFSLCFGLATGCSEDITTTYSTYRAFFYYNKVTTAQPLYSALTDMGTFCSIYISPDKTIHFETLTNSATDNLTAIAYYNRYNAIAGFIAGQGNEREIGKTDLPILCYDLACPNCYENNSITRKLSLQEGGYAFCSRCGRKYNLNKFGIIEEGDKGIKLFRYHISYNGAEIIQISN